MAPAPNRDPASRRRELVDALRRDAGDTETVQRLVRCDQTTAPLSFAQLRLWFLDQLQPGNAFYNVPLVWRFSSRFDVGVFERALAGVVGRHEVLRTRFVTEDGRPMQVIEPEVVVAVRVVDLRGVDGGRREQELARVGSEEVSRPFDLRVAPLLRALLVRLADSEWVLVLTLHHIVSDGWSLGVLWRDLTALYSAQESGRPAGLAPLAVQYADYAVWQREWLSGAVLDEQLGWWTQGLAGAPTLALATDRRRPPVQSFAGASVPVHVPAGLVDRLRALAVGERATLHMVGLAAFMVLLGRYSGQQDIVVGTPIAGRTRSELEQLIGFFVNTLVMRGDLSGDPTFRELLGRVREWALGAFAHQDLPFEALVEELAPERDLSRNPLFQVTFQLYTPPEGQTPTAATDQRPVAIERGTAIFDLALGLWQTADGALTGGVEYSTDLFDRPTIERLVDHFGRLLGTIAADPDQPIGQLTLIGPAERRWLHDQLTGPTTPRDDRLVHHLFEHHAAHHPDGPALTSNGDTLTYGQLNDRANRLAHHLQALGVGPDRLVALGTDRTPAMIIALLAILKAGGAYLPLDPTYPTARLTYMVNDARPHALITQPHLTNHLPTITPTITLTPDGHPTTATPNTTTNPATATQPHHPAYTIYTSGTTGQPKGTTIHHQGLTNCANAQHEMFGLHAGTRVLQFSSICFDASMFELLMWMCSGGVLCLGTRDEISPGDPLLEFLVANDITIVTLPPSALTALPYDDLPALETITVAGEACPAELVTTWAPGRRFFNLYGPTETSIWATVAECTPDGTAPPIGRPIANVRVAVLDERLQTVPTGVVGELCIGGIGVARGYLHRPELTAQRFVDDPEHPGERLYRTGDLARVRPDGTLDFLGRADQQIKLRGHRIELGEIEAAAITHPAVEQAAAAVVGAEDDRRLVVYIVAARGAGAPSTAELRGHLAEQLPGFMLPNAVVTLPALPLSPGGKIDRRRLAELAAERTGADTPHEPPRTPTERALAEIWADVLDYGPVGRQDNFFELGGDSIRSIQVVARARRHGLEVEPRDVFQHQTLAALAQVSRRAPRTAAPELAVEGDVPLTPIQRWFLEPQRADVHHFNQAVLLEVPPLAPDVLTEAVRAVVAHHDALCLRFEHEAGRWRQSSLPKVEPRVEHLSLAGVSPQRRPAAIEEAAAAIQAGFDLAEPPLLRVALIELVPGVDARLLLAAHHLVVDAVSWAILLDDLGTAYAQLARGDPAVLPAPTTSYRRWSHRLIEYAASPELMNEAHYWQTLAALPPSRLPRDNAGGSNRVEAVRDLCVYLDEHATSALTARRPRSGARVHEALLAALAQVVTRWTGRSSLVLDVEGHGRTTALDGVDLSRTVGWFTALYPMELRLDAAGGAAALQAVTRALRHVPRDGIGFGVLRYLGTDSELRARLAAMPPRELVFNYFGQGGRDDPRDGARPAREPVGPTRGPRMVRDHLVEVNAAAVGGRLQVTWSYSEEIHDRPTIARLADDHLAALRDLAEVRQGPDAEADRSRAVTHARLDEEELSRLVARIEGARRAP